MQAFVPKSRKPKFSLHLTIHDLTNIPLSIGTSHVKWHISSISSSLPTPLSSHTSSSAAGGGSDHRGRTEKVLIRDHKAVYDYSKRGIPVRLKVDKAGVLGRCEMGFEVVQEFGHTEGGGRVVLGVVRINLAEYVEQGQTGHHGHGHGHGHGHPQGQGGEGHTNGEMGEFEEGITRKYLMQDSKINSTLKIGICMRQTEGEMNYTAPPLKTATVFGGIAGILSNTESSAGGMADAVMPRGGAGDSGGAHRGRSGKRGKGAQGTGSDHGSNTPSTIMPSLTSRTKEHTELQDIYRRTLAATWACGAGELPPDRLIEDLFAGGDGGAMRPPHAPLKAGKRAYFAKPDVDGSGRRGSLLEMDDSGGSGGSVSDNENRRTVTPRSVPSRYRVPEPVSWSNSGMDVSHSPQSRQKGHRRPHGTRSGSGGSGSDIGVGGFSSGRDTGRGTGHTAGGGRPGFGDDHQGHVGGRVASKSGHKKGDGGRVGGDERGTGAGHAHRREHGGGNGNTGTSRLLSKRDTTEYKEVTEFEVRDDLRSWSIQTSVN